MMRHLLVISGFISGLLLIIGPLRRPLLSQWRLVLPLAIGGTVGWFVIHSKHFLGAPGWMMIVGPVFAGLILGGTIKQGIDEILGPPKGK